MINRNIKEALHEINADHTLIQLDRALESLVPEGHTFSDDEWDVIEWHARKGNSKVYKLYFSKLKNDELKDAVKIYVLDKRLSKQASAGYGRAILDALIFLDRALGAARPLKSLCNADFEEASNLIEKEVKKTAQARAEKFIVQFGYWLTINFGIIINFKRRLASAYQHGRNATDQERESKLINNAVIVDLIQHGKETDLIKKDIFFISVLTLLVGTGFRISELSCLPKDCLIEENGNLGIRYFPEKKFKLATRWLPDDWKEPVKTAYEKIVMFTETGRITAKKLRFSAAKDWTEVFQNSEATKYFVEKFCHEWTANPKHNLMPKDCAWLEKEKRYIDILSIIKQEGSKSAAARFLGISRSSVDYLVISQDRTNKGLLPPKQKGRCKEERTDWDTDSRSVSMVNLEKYCETKGLNKRKYYLEAKSIIDKTLSDYQLKGKVFPRPKLNQEIEDNYKRIQHPVVSDKNGNPLLWAEDALMVVSRYALSYINEEKYTDYSLVSSNIISHWLSGEKRSRGTRNYEDSVFSRLGIIDERTGDIAKFTSHDVRHWLTTYYLEGGMPDEQVALLFGRSKAQNAVYDQTLASTRLKSLKESVKQGRAMGHLADTFNNIASYSREDAEEYLEACTLQINMMPHGACSLNWGIEQCQNHNACFNSPEGVCKSLCLDLNDPKTKDEVKQMHKDAKIAVMYIPESSPQHEHYMTIQRNIESLGVSSDE